MKKIEELIVNGKKYVACCGKSTIPKGSEDYEICKRIGSLLIQSGFGVVTGGYAGGCMEAAAEGAQEMIDSQELNPHLNLAVPMTVFDSYGWPRSPAGIFSKPSKTLHDRLSAIVDTSEIVLILPRGGDGTDLEFSYAKHSNTLRSIANESLKPIILYGSKWKKLQETIDRTLDISKPLLESQPIYCVTSLDELEDVLDLIKS